MQVLLLLALNADRRAFVAPQEAGASESQSKEQENTSPFVGHMIGAVWGYTNELLSERCFQEQMESPGEVGDIDDEVCLLR